MALATLAFALALAALVSLGVWQLHRKAWKEALLARIAALQTAPPEPLGVVLNRTDPTATLQRHASRAVDFVRVQVRCSGLGDGAVHLYGLRAAGPGWRQIAACALPAGLPYRSLLVDLGFEALPPVSPPARQPVDLPAQTSVVGVLRSPDPPTWAMRLAGPATSPANPGQWMRRDIPGMARALHAPSPAPFMLELEQPRAGPTLAPSPLPTDIPNRHMEYALTWFGLALGLTGVYLAFVIRRLRPER